MKANLSVLTDSGDTLTFPLSEFTLTETRDGLSLKLPCEIPAELDQHDVYLAVMPMWTVQAQDYDHLKIYKTPNGFEIVGV